MKLYLERAWLAALFLFSTISASAGPIIFDAGPPSTASTSVYLSDVDASATGSGLIQQIGGYFSLEAGASTISGINWWGIYAANNLGQQPLHDDAFTIRIFNSGASNPFVELAVGNDVHRTDTGSDIAFLGTDGVERPHDVFSYSVDIDPLALAPDTFYLLSIFNNTTGFVNSWSWSQSGTDTGLNTSAVRSAILASPDGNPWTSFSGDMAFNLTAVPEPATLLLFGGGLLGLARVRRRQR